MIPSKTVTCTFKTQRRFSPASAVTRDLGNRKEDVTQYKMGASLDTPAECPVCKQQKSELVILECKHQFCQRCIEDLWSATPDGPYYCPESRCKREFRTLPFNRTSRPRKSSSRRRGAQPSNTAGTIAKIRQPKARFHQ